MKMELLISAEDIKKKVKEMAGRISADYEGKEPVLIGVLNGVIFFFADLAREMTIPYKLDFIRATSYGSGMTSSGNIRFTKDLEIPIKDAPVILVDDMIDTGLTLAHIIKKLELGGPESIRVCTLIDKSERRDVAVHIDYWGFKMKKGFIVGYGIDYDEKYRYLPDIYVLK